jgi:hypothetical protein
MLCVLLIFPCVLHYPPISPSLISSPSYLVKCTNYEAPQYAIVSSHLPFLPSKVQILTSVPCPQTPSMCVLPSKWEITFHTHTKQQVKLRKYIVQKRVIMTVSLNSYFLVLSSAILSSFVFRFFRLYLSSYFIRLFDSETVCENDSLCECYVVHYPLSQV